MAKAELFQKDLPESERVFYYKSEEDDPIKTEEQESKKKVELPADYVYVHKNIFYLLWANVLFSFFWVFGNWYERHYLEGKFVGKEKIKKAKGKRCVIYANHTNPFHDVFGPAVMAGGRIRTVISPVNLLVPGIGKCLPAIGGLPLGSTKEQKKEFNEAVDYYIEKGQPLVIYPEAHVWPYHTGIRKFPAGDRSFKYAVRNKVPIFTMTTTYQKSRRGHARPRMTVYLDGPFYPDEKLSDAENMKMLADTAYKSMVKNSKHSNYHYFKYIKTKNH